MTLTDLQNRTWHLLREDGPDNGFLAPVTGDYNVTVVTRDINIALAQFISQTGIAPAINERQDTYPVFPVLDQPLPPSLISIMRVEYTPYGQPLYKLIAQSFTEFDNRTGNALPTTTGQPYFYREPYAGYIRLQPQPSAGNAVGPGIGSFTLTGTPSAGQQVTAILTNSPQQVTTGVYVVTLADTLSTVAVQIANLVNNSAAVTGNNAFLATTSTSGATIQVTSLLTPGTSITVQINITGTTMVVTPIGATHLTATGDSITYYYTSLGVILVNAGDVPNIPPQFHMALVYRVLVDYWRRKQDFNQSKAYKESWDEEIARGKAYTFDMNRASQPTIAGNDEDSGYVSWTDG
jgi:hypothetical protein